MTQKKNILKSQNSTLTNVELLHYLQKQLTSEQENEIEKQLLESSFYSDAIEGLEEVKDKNNISIDLDQLHQSLKNQIQEQKKKKEKRKIKEIPFIILITVTVLLLCLLAFLVVYYTNR